jgi:hypothetical protein
MAANEWEWMEQIGMDWDCKHHKMSLSGQQQQHIQEE